MVRFLVVEPTHLDSNLRFGMNVAYLWLIIFSVVDDVSVNSETLWVTDFMNLKIKSVQSFKGVHMITVCVYVFIGEYSYIYEYLCLYCISKKTRKASSLSKLQKLQFNQITSKTTIRSNRSVHTMSHIAIVKMRMDLVQGYAN
jgi:hypothetical protein